MNAASFTPRDRMSWERYSTGMYADGCLTNVKASDGNVHLTWVEHRAVMGMDMAPAQARALAAELIAAADAADVKQEAA